MGADQSRAISDAADSANRAVTAATNVASAVSDGANQVRNAYQLVRDHIAAARGRAGRVAGGCEDDLATAGGGAGDEAKDLVLRGVARALKEAGLSGLDPEAEGSALVAQLDKLLPNPSKGRSIADQGQEKACRVIGEALNKQFTPLAKEGDRLVPSDMPPSEMCSRVAALMHSLAGGVQAEFLQIHGQAEVALQRLRSLGAILDALQRRSAGGEAVGELFRAVRLEADRQVELLSRLLGTTLKTGEQDIAASLAKGKKFYVQVLKLAGSKLDTAEFGDAMAYMLLGSGAAAKTAQLAQEALQKVGASLAEYKESPSWAAFKRLADERMLAGSGASYHDIREAVETLQKLFEVRGTLGGGRRGGAEVSELELSLKKARREAREIVVDYLRKSHEALARFARSTREVASRIGREVPFSEPLERLAKSMDRFTHPNTINDELKVIGFSVSAEARAFRDKYLQQLREVDADMAACGEGFAAPRAAIAELLRLAAFYSEALARLTAPLGGRPPLDESTLRLFEVSVAQVEFDEVKKRLAAAIKLAAHLDSMKRQYAAMTHDTKTQDQVLTEAIAAKIKTLREARDKFLADFYDNDKLKMKAGAKWPSEGDAILAEGDVTDKTVEAWAAAREQFVKNHAVRAEFYEVLRAIDEQIRVFSADVALSATDMYDAARLLTGVVMIPNWYTDRFGDELAAFFDGFGAQGSSKDNDIKITKSVIGADAGVSYYGRLTALYTTSPGTHVDNTVGDLVPVAGVQREQQRRLASAFQAFPALKNIINCFVRIGARESGGRTPHRTGLQIYRGLLDYLQASALTVGKAGVDVDMHHWKATKPAMAAMFAYTPAVAGSTNANALVDDWQEDDRYFEEAMQAICGKIATALQVCRLQDVQDATDVSTIVKKVLPVRMMAGGAEPMRPQAIPEAAGLYFRAIRLAEYYRRLIHKGTTAGLDKHIGIPLRLSASGGVFDDLLNLVFVQSRESSLTGTYNVAETYRIIAATNGIYEHFRGKQESDVINAALVGLVAEVNRRFAIIAKGEEQTRQKLSQADDATFSDRAGAYGTQYAILPGEDDMYGTEPLRAEKADDTLAKKPLPDFAAADSTRKIFLAFRNLVEQDLTDSAAKAGDSGYRIMLERTREAMAAAGEDERLMLAMGLIQGTKQINAGPIHMSYEYHEEVMYPLALLQNICKFFDSIQEVLTGIDITAMDKAIRDWKPTADLTFDDLKKACGKSTGLLWDKMTDGSDARTWYGISGNGVVSPHHVVTVKDAIAACLNGSACDNIDDAQKAEALAQARLRFFCRPLFTMSHLLRVILMLKSGMSDDISVRISETETAQFAIDFSGIIDICTALFDRAEKGLQKVAGNEAFRAAVTRQTEQMTKLRANLMDSRVRGKQGSLGNYLDEGDTWTFRTMVHKINGIYALLVRKYAFIPIVGSDTPVAKAGLYDSTGKWPAAKDESMPITPSSPTTLRAVVSTSKAPDSAAYVQYGETLSKFLAMVSSSENAVTTATSDAFVSTLTGPVMGPASKGERKAEAGEKYVATANGAGWGYSLAAWLNRLLEGYVQQFYDANTRRIYSGLLVPLQEGALGGAISAVGGDSVINNYSNNSVTISAFGASFVLKSTVMAMRNLMMDTDRVGGSAHLIPTLSEAPSYYLENMRGMLPFYARHIKMIERYGDFLGKFMAALGPRRTMCEDRSVAMLSAATAAGATVADVQSRAVKIATQRASELITICSQVTAAAERVGTTIQSVRRELADRPQFMQTSEGAFGTYKSRYGTDPLTPASDVYLLLRRWGDVDLQKTFSRRAVAGTPAMQVFYGLRGLLGDTKPADEARAPMFLLDTAEYGSQYWLPERGQKAFRPASTDMEFAVYARDEVPLTVISAVSAVSRAEAMKAVAGKVAGSSSATATERQDSIYGSLIELRLMPVDLNALSASVPMAATFHYAAAMRGMSELKTDYTELSSFVTSPMTATLDQLKLLAKKYEGFFMKQMYGKVLLRSSDAEGDAVDSFAGLATASDDTKVKMTDDKSLIPLFEYVRELFAGIKLALRDNAITNWSSSVGDLYSPAVAAVANAGARYGANVLAMKGDDAFTELGNWFTVWKDFLGTNTDSGLRLEYQTTPTQATLVKQKGDIEGKRDDLLKLLVRVASAINTALDAHAATRMYTVVLSEKESGLKVRTDRIGNAADTRNIPTGDMSELIRIGKDRFDTTLVRKVLHVAALQQTLNLLIRSAVRQVRPDQLARGLQELAAVPL